MYGSYGSYSSMSSTSSSNTDMAPSNFSAHDSTTCAFPSWPRRSSLGESDSLDSPYSRPTSFLSDDDLFFCTSASGAADPFDECPSPSNASSARSSIDLARHEVDAMARERERLQREAFVRQAVLEKEGQRRRQQQAMRRAQLSHGGQAHQQQQQQQQRRSSPKKNPKSKLTSIREAQE